MIHVSGLYFFDINENVPFELRSGAPWYQFGIEYAPHHTPLPFQYLSDESVTSFKLIGINSNQQIVSETSLDASLINSDGTNHLCDGLTEYSEVLTPGVYYFLVNDKYRSANFQAVQIEQGVGYDIIECSLIVY